MTVCKKNTYTALCVVDWVCDETYPPCTPVCYKGMYYIARTDDATGQPNKAENSEMWLGGYEALDGGFFKAMAECVECCGGDPIPDTFMQVVNNEDGTFSAIDNEGNPIGSWATDTTIPDTDTFMRVINNGDGSFSAIDNEGNAVGTWFTDTDTHCGPFVETVLDNGDRVLRSVKVDHLNSDAPLDPEEVCQEFTIPADEYAVNLACMDGNLAIVMASGAVIETGEACDTVIPDTDTFGTIVDNGDGSFTWTSADGESTSTWSTDTGEPIPDTTIPDTDTALIAKPSTTDADGVVTTCFDYVNVVDGSVITADVWCHSTSKCTNPIVDIRCNQRGIRWTDCDGNQAWASPDIVTVTSFLEANSINIDETTPLGVIAGTEHSANISAVICGSRFPIENYFTMKQNADGAGDVRVRPQWQIDGGGWQNFTTGGADEFFINEGQVFSGEIMQLDFADTDPQALGLHTIEVRYLLEANNLSGGASFTNGQTNFQVQRVQMNCC